MPLPRLFSTFPRGVAGTGLLLLRITIGLIVTMQGQAYLVAHETIFDDMWLLGATALLLGLALVVGILTRPAAVLAAVGAIGTQVAWFPSPGLGSRDNMLSTILIVVVSIAVALIGPGAFSLDARLFGFRRIVIPLSSNRPPRD